MPEADSRTLRLFCQREDETYRVIVGGSWLPKRLRPFLSPTLETGPLLLDFAYLERILESRNTSCDVRRTRLSDIEITASGDGARALAKWLGSSLASVVLSKAE